MSECVYSCCKHLLILLMPEEKTRLVNRDVAEAWGAYFRWSLPACSHLYAKIFHISLHKAATVQASRSIITSLGGKGLMKTTAFGIQQWGFFFFFNQHFCSCDFPNMVINRESRYNGHELHQEGFVKTHNAFQWVWAQRQWARAAGRLGLSPEPPLQKQFQQCSRIDRQFVVAF